MKPSAALVEEILSMLAKQDKSNDRTKKDGTFIPYPPTWLNERRWEDEAPASAPKSWCDGLTPAETARKDRTARESWLYRDHQPHLDSIIGKG